jgi:hypothetical protein
MQTNDKHLEVINFAVNELLQSQSKQEKLNKLLLGLIGFLILSNSFMIYQHYRHHKDIYNVYFSITKAQEQINGVQISDFGRTVIKNNNK